MKKAWEDKRRAAPRLRLYTAAVLDSPRKYGRLPPPTSHTKPTKQTRGQAQPAGVISPDL